jgi:hypothetical protein
MAKQFNDPTITAGTPGASDRIPWFDGTTGKVSYITLANLQAITGWTGGGGGDVTAPTVVSMTVEDANPDRIVVVFSESVTVTTAGWSAKLNGGAWSISSVSGAGTTWTFIMGSSADSDDTLLISYDSTTGATVDTATNELVSFTDDAVTNNVAGGLPHTSNFTAANGTLLTAYTPDAGNQWTNELGTLDIQSSKASVLTDDGAGNVVMLTDFEATEYTATVIAARPAGGGRGVYIKFRYVDANNNMVVVITGNTVVLYEVVSGVATQVGSTHMPTPSINDTANHTFVLTVGSTTCSLLVDGNSAFSGQPIDASLSAGTIFGVGGSSTPFSAGDVTIDSVAAVA